MTVDQLRVLAHNDVNVVALQGGARDGSLAVRSGEHAQSATCCSYEGVGNKRLIWIAELDRLLLRS